MSPTTDHIIQPSPASRRGIQSWPEIDTSLSSNTERNTHRRKQKATTPSKRRGPQSRLPPEARQILEQEFASNPYPCSWEVDIIAHRTKLDVKRVRTWFNNTRSRKQGSKHSEVNSIYNDDHGQSVAAKLSWESLEALSKEVDDVPQPPLEAYLASSYDEEAVPMSAIQAAIDCSSTSERADTLMDSSSASRIGRTGSVITSLTSSDDSVPTSFTVSSGGSNVSSFGRDRRRGRRRMSWRSSPYAKTRIAGQLFDLPNKDLTFFCTFCPRSYKTKYEWTRHEDSVHALRTTWVCCSASAEALQTCPFCGEPSPDQYHLANHNYQQCHNKSEPQRTFFRRDHFVQHLHHVHFKTKHPSQAHGCQIRLASASANNYGCKDLAMTWRKFGAPMRNDDPMLKCGFCGHISKDWNGRCDHVANHLSVHNPRRSAWWPERAENRLDNLCVPQTIGPFRCRYCQMVFTDLNGLKKHSTCSVWSCRFLGTFDDIASESSGPPLCPQFPSPRAHHCHLCGAGYRSTTSHTDHAQQYHSYRQCNQELYWSEQDFLDHLHEFHGAAQTQLLQQKIIIDKNFSRRLESAFEPIGFEEMLQGCRMASPSSSFVDPFTEEPPPLTLDETPDVAMSSPSSPVPRRRTARERLSAMTDIPAKVRQQRSHREALMETEMPGPRFFRLDPIMPFLATRIYFLRNAKMANLLNDGRAFLEEVPRSHIASLVMSSGLVGMAGVRLPVQVKKDDERGLVEFALED
ncbi:hypothetical protein BDV96DRAFT_494941 [Lophiotrema nucula]|uniref:Homeobox domain-containing protein n=1 Tax=Lophiotrema nucula TaxID=690887 RepID=A0A6A5Z4H3_9PLEO|nr:hypothetical protein BDV96DRAFT_494941 [Lophiotrema nucula]